MFNRVKVNTALNFTEAARGNIVIEGAGYAGVYSHPYRLAAAWEWVEGNLIANGNLLINTRVHEDVFIVNDNGVLAFLLPGGDAECTVSYLSPKNSNVPNTGWSITGLTDDEYLTFTEKHQVTLSEVYSSEAPEVLVGMPLPWVGTEVPDGYLPYTGIAFDKIKFPKLANIYPSGVLLDLRGDFLRAAEIGRTLLSRQGDTVRESMRGTFALVRHYNNGDYSTGCSGAFKTGGVISGVSAEAYNQYGSRSVIFDPGPTSSEVRPVNTAFMYITKAG